ncbi:MAG: class I SAM-dependent methyltransferase [Dehalococcoidales bacterium]|nr:class I SAM-dependent methyltransferase [Dehalococcoidales bacterium]
MTHYHHGCRYMPDDFRRQWQNPEIILNKIGLKQGDIFVDIGCGNGYFAIPAAKIVGEKGTIYGLDVNEEAIAELNERAKSADLKNLIITASDAATTCFGEAFADIVFFGIDLHDFVEPSIVLQNAHRMLKANGKLGDLDFKKIHMEFGPPYEIRFSEAKAKELIERAGFITESIEDIPPYNYLIIARPVQLK